MKKIEKIYEGKAKILYSTKAGNKLIQYFKDDATAFNNLKKDVLAEKGILNNFICEKLMRSLQGAGIKTHFIKRLNEREQLVKKVSIIPLEVIVRNVIAGGLAKKLGIDEGEVLPSPIIELCYKNDALGDPLINDDHAITVLRVINSEQLKKVKKITLKINQILKKIFDDAQITLVDFKIEFGIDEKGKLLVADEISPDSCRLWDKASGYKLDKDRFRRDLGDVTEAYREVAKRLKVNF